MSFLLLSALSLPTNLGASAETGCKSTTIFRISQPFSYLFRAQKLKITQNPTH